MKYFLLFIASVFSVQLYAQKKTFDIISFTTPKGWELSEKNETVTFTKEEDGKGFCIITLYKSIDAGIDAGSDAQHNFNMAWETLVQANLGAGAVQMQPGSTDNGWETKIGSAPFEKNGVKGAAILISSSNKGKLVNIVCLSNTNAYLKEMEAFMESVSLKKIVATNNDTSTSAAVQSAYKEKNKPELWVNRRLTPKMNVGGIVDGNQQKVLDIVIDYYVIFPNGDYHPNPPYQGLINFDRSYQPESWGKFSMQGTKGRFKSKYDDIAVTKKTSTLMEKDGYSMGFHKCLNVDGVRLEGAWTHVSPVWGKDPKLDYLSGPGCQFVIYFKRDGTFDDKGIFYKGGDPNTNDCPGGKGTYSIENFTITFRYNDGRVVHRLYSAPPTRNPATYDETIYMGTTAYYKKL